MVFCPPLQAATLHVWQESPGSSAPYESWASAAHSIQEAVDAAVAGDTVLVTNGVYETGGRMVNGTITNRVVIDKAITVQSVTGPAHTIIAGAPGVGGGNGPGAVRCAYVASGAVLIGFTLTNGHTLTSAHFSLEESGGGVWCEAEGIVRQCVLTGNSAAYYGGGAYRGILHGCTIVSNSVSRWGGGAAWSTLYNCLLVGNSAGSQGGGLCRATLYNCTVTANSAERDGGGAQGSHLENSILYFNSAPTDPNHFSCSLNYSCTTPLPPEGTANIEIDPGFTNAADGDYRLRSDSPCIDVGADLSFFITNDLVGVLRPQDGNRDGSAAFDMGAYELEPVLESLIPVDWLLSYGVDPTDPEVAYQNPDEDPHNNLEEWMADTDPTNANSFFHLTAITKQAAAVVQFLSSSNRVYTLLFASDPGSAVWTPLPGQVDVPGNGQIQILTDPDPGADRYYRVSVTVP